MHALRSQHRSIWSALAAGLVMTAASLAQAARPAEPEAPAKAAESAQPGAPVVGRATRVAILNFGPPSDWQGSTGSMVGTVANAKAWKEAVPLLKKDKVDVVVVRINSGGGLLLEISRFHEVYEKDYKPNFRTVGWVESAISAAAMSPYVLEEFYFMPEGNLGACTGWSGQLTAVKGMQLEMVLHLMEKASATGKRDPKIMRAMQIQEPLTANIDENGDVTFFQNESGAIRLNPPEQILTLNATDALKVKFSRGTAATKEELVQVMGITEHEFAGLEATKFIDQNMRSNDRAEKRFNDFYAKYSQSVGAAQSIADRDQRRREVGVARRHLTEIKAAVRINPNFALLNGLPDNWFEEQEDLLKQLAK